MIAKVRTEIELDRQTRRLIGDVLAAEKPQAAKELADAGEMTLGQAIRKYVARQPLSQETGKALIDLLKTLELATVQASPSLTAANGRQFELRNVSEEWFSPHRLRPAQAGEEPNLIRFEYGTTLKGTARAENNASVTLDMDVWSSEPESKADPNALPVVRRMATSTTVNVPNDRYFSLLVESTGRRDVKTEDAESLLVMVKPSVVRPVSGTESPSATQPPENAKRPAQVLLDVRVVKMELSNLMNLGVEWSYPTMEAGEFHDADSWAKAIGLGCSADSASTSSLLKTLNQLAHTNQIELVSNPQIVALDGNAAQLRSIREEWFLMSDPSTFLPPELQKIDSGTILTMTPRIGDNNDITLEMAIEVSQSQYTNPSPDLPIVTRRQAKNKVTLMSGGTVAVAGLRPNPVRPGISTDTTARETAIFVTATRITDNGEVVTSYLSRRRSDAPVPISGQVESPGPVSLKQALATPAGPPSVSPKAVMQAEDSPTARTSRDEEHPRQIFLDARIVEIERTDLTNLMTQWSLPGAQAGQIRPDGRRPEGIQIAFLPDRAHTDSFWEELRLLVTTHRARIMDNPQFVSTDGHPIELLSFGEEWSYNPDEESAREAARGREECKKVLAGTSLLATPTIADSNGITLEMEIGNGDSSPKRRRDDRPIAMQRVARDSVTVTDGGIVAVAGLPVRSQTKRTTKMIAVFITTTCVPDADEIVPSYTSIEKTSPRALLPAGSRAQIHLTATLARIPSDRTLDRDTAAKVFNLIAPAGDEQPAMSLEELRTSGVARVLGVLAGQTADKRFQDVIRLLESKGFLDRASEPQLCIPLGEQAHISAGGLTLDIRPEMLNAGKTIQLHVEASLAMAEPIPSPRDDAGDPSAPMMTTQTLKSSGVIEVPNGRHGILRLGGVTSGTDQAEEEVYSLILHPALLASEMDSQSQEPNMPPA